MERNHAGAPPRQGRAAAAGHQNSCSVSAFLDLRSGIANGVFTAPWGVAWTLWLAAKIAFAEGALTAGEGRLYER